MKLLEAVYLLFFSQTQEEEGDLEERVSEGISRCEALIQKIRNFNRSVPLGDLLKVMHEDPFFSVSTSAGGEDWFYNFHRFWENVLAEKMRIYSREKTLADHVSELLRYWDVPVLEYVRGYPLTDRLTVYPSSLASLGTFYNENFQKVLYYPMKIILVDGSFYKKNNREEYERTFQDMTKIGERLRWFEQHISPDGDAGGKIRDIGREFLGDEEALEREMLKVYNGINREAQTIVEDSLRCFESMGKLMNGVVLGNGGTYDTLSNLPELGGRNNEELRQSIVKAGG